RRPPPRRRAPGAPVLPPRQGRARGAHTRAPEPARPAASRSRRAGRRGRRDRAGGGNRDLNPRASPPRLMRSVLPIYGEVAPKAPEGPRASTSPLAGEVGGRRARPRGPSVSPPRLMRSVLPIYGEVAPKAPEGAPRLHPA